MSPLPTSVRASIGLAAVAVSTARELPRKIVELPVIAAGAALQISLRAQQQYAELIAKGDDILGQLRGIPDEPPSWATFDESPAAEPPSGDRVRPVTTATSPQAADLADAIEEEAIAELLEAEALAALEDAEADSIAEALDTAALAVERPLGPPASKTAAKKARPKSPAAPRDSRTSASGETSESPNGTEPPETPPAGGTPAPGVDPDLPRD
jgi:hypothetical protein